MAADRMAHAIDSLARTVNPFFLKPSARAEGLLNDSLTRREFSGAARREGTGLVPRPALRTLRASSGAPTVAASPSADLRPAAEFEIGWPTHVDRFRQAAAGVKSLTSTCASALRACAAISSSWVVTSSLT